MAGFDLKSLQTRALSALVLIPAVLAILYFGGWVLLAFIVLMVIVSLYELISLAAKCSGSSKFLYVLLGMPYVVITFACCYLIFYVFGMLIAIVFLLMVWGSDIGAYFTGKLIGGPKMAEGISPNKTWAGFVGALVAPGILGAAGFFGLDFMMDAEAARPVFYIALFVVGVVVGVAGQGGDLLVSALKRRAGVKDTGNLIPGHGGLLDRVDSMLLAAPVFFILTQIVFYYV